ncbi:MAG: hypothetical protein JWO56_1191 [Acidobacteria bacterium]|nr:hypothetical protein [Acidobacteriota bacterium]
MKRPLTDVLRRGFDDLLANWPLVLIRVAESVLFVGIIIAAIVAIVVPLIVSAGIGNWDRMNADPDAIARSIALLFIDHWVIIVYILLVALAVITIFLAIHGAIEAGCARIYIDAEAAASISRMTTRDRFAVFTMERFLDGVREGWWTTFWIYNLAWSVAGLIILLPVAAAGLLMMAVGPNAGALVIGCLLGLVMFVVIVAVALLTSVWVQKAILLAVGRGLPAGKALSEARYQLAADLWRHIGLVLLMLVLSLVGTAIVSSMSAGFAFGVPTSLSWQLLVSPIRIVSSLLNALCSAAMASWFLACLASIYYESPR